MLSICPLCSSHSRLKIAATPITFWSCRECGLYFKDPQHHLSADREKQRYMQHKNSPESQGYRDFLAPVVKVIVEQFASRQGEGLDFGCGPGPVLAQMLEEAGFKMKIYDPFFFQEFPPVPEGGFDFLVCTEAAEHFFSPAREVERMAQWVKPQAPLVWLTSLWREEGEITEWYYAKDPSHVCFFTERTVDWLASYWGKKAHTKGKNLIWWL